MHEPKYIPRLTAKAEALSGLRWTIERIRRKQTPNDPNADALHVHDYLEIFFAVSTDASFLVNGNVYPVPNGAAVVSRAQDIHMGVFHTDAIHEYICLWIDLGEAFPQLSFLQKKDYCPLFVFEEAEQRKLKELFFALAAVSERGDHPLEEMAHLLGILMLFEKKQFCRVQRASVPGVLQAILHDIQENYAVIGSVGDLAARHYISCATLTRLFRRYVHVSAREYIESVRLSNAARMLGGGESVTDACFASGFSDCSYFVVRFKKRFGKTPYRYKKELM